jgi:hypothetical protein
VLVWNNRGFATAVASATTTSEGIVELLTTTELLTGTDTTRAATADSIAALWESNTTDVTDGATITIGEGHYFNLITSTTAITAFSITTDRAGREFWVKFNTSRTLTHNATSLEIVEGGASLSMVSGDYALIQSKGSGNVRVLKIVRANGTAVVASGGAWTHIETLNPSAVADIKNTVSFAGYNLIRITYYGLTPATNGASLRTQTSTDGSTFNDWDSGLRHSSDTTTPTPTHAASVYMTLNTGNDPSNTATDGGANGEIILHNYNQSENATAFYKTNYITATILFYQHGSLRESGTTARTHIKFIFSSGNITSGRIVIEGIA